MFENIIGQEGIVESLKRELQKKELPSSILFYGEEFSGKLTAALELARALSCEKETAEWSCRCGACEKHRLLINPNTIMLGGRYFYQEIAASADVLKRTGNRSSQYLFLRAVRKLTRRFDDFLWDGNEHKTKKVTELVRALEDELDFFLPGNTSRPYDELEKHLSSILDVSSRVVSSINLQTIPIDIIRRVNYWTHTTSPGAKKIVIIENAHKMLDSARNALLKILEEPPPGVFFILITPRKSSLIATILSRVRHYYFKERSRAETEEVLKKIFKEENGEYSGIKDYFLAWTGMNKEVIDRAVNAFFKYIIDEGRTPHLSLEEDGVFSQLDDRESVLLFLRELLERLRTIMVDYCNDNEKAFLLSLFEKIRGVTRETATMVDVYNQRPLLALQSFFLQTRDLVGQLQN